MISAFQNAADTGQDKIVELTWEKLRKYEGSWHQETAELFPGYIMIDADNRKNLAEKLKCTDTELYSVDADCENTLRELCNSDGHLPISRGVIRKGVTYVTEGPLKGKEEMISRIDRHKRLAMLKISAIKDEQPVRVGLEITDKSL